MIHYKYFPQHFENITCSNVVFSTLITSSPDRNVDCLNLLLNSAASELDAKDHLGR